MRQLLATQPSELAAAAHELGADRVRRLLIDQFKTPRALSPSEVHAQLERSRRLLDELRDWLDTAHRLCRTLGQSPGPVGAGPSPSRMVARAEARERGGTGPPPGAHETIGGPR